MVDTDTPSCGACVAQIINSCEVGGKTHEQLVNVRYDGYVAAGNFKYE